MPYIASNPEQFLGKKIGDGGPLAFVERASNAPPPNTWHRGRAVMPLSRHDIARGTVIMAFGHGHEMRHGPGLPVGLYLGHDGQHLYILDQHNHHAVAPRVIHISTHSNPADNAAEYHIVE